MMQSGKTVTLHQLIVNGDFHDGQKRWSSGNSSLSMVGNKMRVTRTYDNTASWFFFQGIVLEGNHRFFAHMELQRSSDNKANALLRVSGPNENYVMGSFATTQPHIAYTETNPTKSASTGVMFYPFQVSVTTVPNPCYADIFFVEIFDLTADFGEGNEPSKEEFFNLIKDLPYWEGAKTIRL